MSEPTGQKNEPQSATVLTPNIWKTRIPATEINMSALRRSPRLASIRIRQEQVAIIRRTLEYRLALIDQAYAGDWTTQMVLRDITEKQSVLNTSIMKLLLHATRDTRKSIMSLMVYRNYSSYAILTKDIDALEETYIDMLRIVKSLQG